MVSTLNMSRVGYMHTDCIIPMAGNNPYATCKEDVEELHTPAEGTTWSLRIRCGSLGLDYLVAVEENMWEFYLWSVFFIILTMSAWSRLFYTFFILSVNLFSSTVYTAAELKLAVLQIRAPIIQVNTVCVCLRPLLLIVWSKLLSELWFESMNYVFILNDDVVFVSMDSNWNKLKYLQL